MNEFPPELVNRFEFILLLSIAYRVLHRIQSRKITFPLHKHDPRLYVHVPQHYYYFGLNNAEPIRFVLGPFIDEMAEKKLNANRVVLS